MNKKGKIRKNIVSDGNDTLNFWVHVLDEQIVACIMNHGYESECAYSQMHIKKEII